MHLKLCHCKIIYFRKSRLPVFSTKVRGYPNPKKSNPNIGIVLQNVCIAIFTEGLYMLSFPLT